MRKEQGAQPRLKGEITQLCDVVVGEVDCVVILIYIIRENNMSGRSLKTYARSTHVLNRGDFVAYSLERIDINEAHVSVVSVLFNAPRKSSSRSVRQLMKERELLIRSVVNLIFAVLAVL